MNNTDSQETAISIDSSPESIDRASSDSWENVPGSAGRGIASSDHGSTSEDGVMIKTDSLGVENPNPQWSNKDKDERIDRTREGMDGGYHNESSNNTPVKLQPASTWENKIIKPIQQIFYRKKPVTEKSSLVKHKVEEYDEDEVIMPELPDPRESCSQNQFQDLPEGIGTGKIGSNFGYSKMDEERKQASTYADAAKGLLMSFLGAGVMYGITAVLVRLAGQEGIDPIAVMFIRSVFQALIFGSTLIYKRIGWRPPPGRALRCCWISVVYCIASISSYEAFDVIPPGSAVATRGAARTIFSIIFAFFMLREGVSLGDIIGLLCCFGGIALIIASGLTSGDKDYIQPPGLGDNATTIRIYGFSLLIVSAIGRSIGHVGVRGARAAGLLLVTLRQPSSPLTWKGVAYVAVVCVASSIATFASNQAVKYAHPALVSFGQNADVAVSLTLEHILIARSPRVMELSGVLTIFFGLCGLTLYKWMQSKKLEAGRERLQ